MGLRRRVPSRTESDDPRRRARAPGGLDVRATRRLRTRGSSAVRACREREEASRIDVFRRLALEETTDASITMAGPLPTPWVTRVRPSTLIRTVASHDVVRLTFPRPVTERDRIGMAAGKSIDTAVTELSHQYRQGRRPTLASADRLARETFDDEVAAAMLELTPEDRQLQIRQIGGAVRAFRASPLFGLSRPKSRLIVIDERVGIYAQPDYWDGRDRFYEMKSYHSDPVHPDVLLQLQLFQLAFPKFQAVLVEIDRHADPTRAELRPIPPVTDLERDRVLRLARDVALAEGEERVLEFVDNPVVRYAVAP
jgi:hypothetical protein